MSKRLWTETEMQRLRELKAQGMPRIEIARVLGRSLKAVEHHIYDKPAVAMQGGRGTRLAEEEIAWLIKHYKHTPNADIQRRLSLSFSSLHRLAREMGLKKSPQFMRKAQEAAAAAAYESHKRNGTFPPKGYVIPRSDVGRFKPGKGHGIWDRVSRKKAKEMMAKSHESWRKTYEKDKRRVLYWGFEPQTKFRFSTQSSQKLNYRYGLRKCGYIEDPDDHNLYYYPNEEMRRPMRESHAAKFGIRIQPTDSTL